MSDPLEDVSTTAVQGQPPPVTRPRQETVTTKSGARGQDQLTASNLQTIPNAEELAPGIRLGPQGNEAFEHDADRQYEADTTGQYEAHAPSDDERHDEQHDDSHAERRASILTTSSDAHGKSGPPSVMGSVGPSASIRNAVAPRARGSGFSNTVGHFGSRGEAVAGVPPELDPRGPDFRPPSPSAASIYSVSVQAPASPQAVEHEADDYTSHGQDSDLLGDATPGLTASSITHSPLASVSVTPSVGGSSYPPTPGSTIASGIPASTLDQIRANPRGLVFSPAGGGVPVSAASGLYVSRAEAPSSPSVAATAGSEYPSSSYAGSSRPPSIRDEGLASSPPLSATGSHTTNPGEAQQPYSSSLSGSSDVVDDDDGSPSGGRATSFAGTSVGAVSTSSRLAPRTALSASSTTIPSIAPSEAGSGADESDFAMAPPEVPSFTTTGPGLQLQQHQQQSQPLPLSFGPGLAAFRSSLAAGGPGAPSRAGSTAATAGTSSPTRSVVSAGSDRRGASSVGHGSARRGSDSSLETVGSSVVQSESGAAAAGGASSTGGGVGLSSRRMSRQMSSSAYQHLQDSLVPASEMEAMSFSSKPPSVSGSSSEDAPPGAYPPGTAF